MIADDPLHAMTERYRLDMSIDEYDAHLKTLDREAKARAHAIADARSHHDAVAREAARVAAIRASLAGVRYDDDPGFKGLSYVGDAFAPVAVYR